jgi:hypothetical protein
MALERNKEARLKHRLKWLAEMFYVSLSALCAENLTWGDV